MDLGAFAQIDKLMPKLIHSGIYIPRIRGLRLMEEQQPPTEEELNKIIKNIGLEECEMAVESHFSMSPCCYEVSYRVKKLIRKYFSFTQDERGGWEKDSVKWENIHGRKRKVFKYTLRQSEKRIRKTFDTFSKYCGMKNVMCVHTRIGGGNWIGYGGKVLEHQPWFIERVDDFFDDTYCDIYVRLRED